MARISGVDIPREKRVAISLTYIHGIGRPTAAKMCDDLAINPNTRVRDLSDSDVNKIRMYIENNLKVEGDRRRDVQQDIKRKIETGSYQAPATARVCRCVASARTPTRAPARARRRPSPTRKSP